MIDKFSKPRNKDEELLAGRSFAAARAKGVQGDEVWEEAAKLYNSSLVGTIQDMRDSGLPSSCNYQFAPIDRTLFKKYWEDLSAGTVVQRAGAESAFLPQPVAGGAGQAAGGRAAEGRVLLYEAIKSWSGNKLKKECRSRGVQVANTTQPAECMKRLKDAGFLEMPAAAVGV